MMARMGLKGASDGSVLREELMVSLQRLKKGYRSETAFTLIS